MTAPHRTEPLLVCLFLWFAAFSASAAACGTWNANLAASLTAGYESEAITYTWNTVVSSCISPPHAFTFDHYLICWKQAVNGTTPSAPTSPVGTGVTCHVLSSSQATTTKDVYVNRSDREYSSTIFACQSSGTCVDYYGDATHGSTVTNNTVSGTLTEPEKWLVKDTQDYTDTTGYMVGGAAIEAVAAMFYPTGFTDVNKLGLWYTVLDGSLNSVTKYQETHTTGWVDGSSNDMVNRTWDAAANPVAQSSLGSGSDFYHAGNPWVVPAVTSGGTKYVRMFLQTGNMVEDYNIRSLDSTDQNGKTFGLKCTAVAPATTCPVSGSGTCADGDYCSYNHVTTVEEICPTVTSMSCFYFNHAGHGRIGWDATDVGPVNFSSDTPLMLLTGRGDVSHCDANEDDIYDATWVPGTGLWSVNTHTSGGVGCPTLEFQDGHDPYILPLADGTFKGYYNDPPRLGKAAYVCYSHDGSPGSWEACVQIVMGFQDADWWDGSPADPHDCLGDTEMFAWQDGATRHEGGFTLTQNDMGCFSNEKRLLFIEHEN